MYFFAQMVGDFFLLRFALHVPKLIEIVEDLEGFKGLFEKESAVFTNRIRLFCI